MRLLMLSSKLGKEDLPKDYRLLEQRMEELERRLDYQTKEIFDLKWELSSLRNSLSEENAANEHALLNDVVLRNLVYFFSKKDLLNVRLACRKWNNVVLPRIRKEFRFHFTQYYGWILIYLLIYAVLLLPRILIGSNTSNIKK